MPEKMPSIVTTLSPVASRSVRSTLRIGSPAPTVVSSPQRAPVASMALTHSFQRARSPEPGVRMRRLASSKPATKTKNAADVGSVRLTNSVGFTRTPF